MNQIAEFISLALTLPTILLATLVVYKFGPRAYASVERVCQRHPSNTDLLILGITIGFIGSAIDNLYWGLAWSADFFGHSLRDELFKHGVWTNIPFRQVSGVIAAACHLWAAYLIAQHRFKIFLWTTFITVIGAVLLLIAKLFYIE